MADWNYTPQYPYSGKPKSEKLIVNMLEDFSEIRVEKGSTIGSSYTEKYRVSASELTSMLSFWSSYRMTRSFTKKTFDPLSIGFDPDDVASASGPEETVRFASNPSWSNTTLDDYSVTFSFMTLPNE